MILTRMRRDAWKISIAVAMAWLIAIGSVRGGAASASPASEFGAGILCARSHAPSGPSDHAHHDGCCLAACLLCMVAAGGAPLLELSRRRPASLAEVVFHGGAQRIPTRGRNPCQPRAPPAAA